MDIEPKDILELMKSVPMMHSEITGLKSSISAVEKDLERFSKAISSLSTSIDRVDTHVGDVTNLKYSVQAMQDSMHDLLSKIKDIAEKYRDVMDAIKNSDRSEDDRHHKLMRSVYEIENSIKDSLNRQESHEATLHSMSDKIENLSRRGSAMEKAAAQPETQETMFERIIKVAPNFIAIITFLGYIIYTLIEHKLMGKM
jgi:chromosome segregation ATPase